MGGVGGVTVGGVWRCEMGKGCMCVCVCVESVGMR